MNLRILRFIFALGILAWSLRAQNRIAVTQIAAPASVTRVLLVYDGFVRFATLGDGITLDPATMTLRVTVPSVGGVDTRQRFVAATNQTNFILAGTPQPGSLVHVSVNGLEEDPDILTMTGATLVFRVAPAAGSLVLVTYRR